MRTRSRQRTASASAIRATGVAACLQAVAENATGPGAEAQRLAIADGVRALDRVRKWADSVAASLKSG